MAKESNEERDSNFLMKLIVYAALVFGLHAFYYGTIDIAQWTMEGRSAAIVWYIFLLIFF